MDISIEDRNKTVVVTLPQPQILSHEVYPKIENLDVGWMRELNTQDFNDNINKLRQAFREDALNSDIMNKARQRAGNVMDMMLTPVVQNISKKYKITIRFRNNQEVLDYNLPQDGGTKSKNPQTPQQLQQPKQQPQRPDAPQYYKPSSPDFSPPKKN